MEIKGLEVAVFKAERPITEGEVRALKLREKADFLSGLHRLSVEVDSADLASAEFFVKKRNEPSWQSVGVDLNQPFSTYLNPGDYSGSLVFKAVVTNSKGERYESKQQAFSITAP